MIQERHMQNNMAFYGSPWVSVGVARRIRPREETRRRDSVLEASLLVARLSASGFWFSSHLMMFSEFSVARSFLSTDACEE